MKPKKKTARPAGSRSYPPAAPIPSPTPTAASLIGGDTRKRLDRFCSAHFGADPDVVVLNAVNDYITRDLEANTGVSNAYNGI